MLQLDYPVVLASGSPRRQELLSQLVDGFLVDPADVDEDALTVEDPWQTAKILAREKALEVFARHPDSIVIGGDTVVAIEIEGVMTQLSKPVDEGDAARMLGLLSGKTHEVLTGICIKWPKGISSFVERSEVTFAPMTDGQIRSYIATGEPMDKAGAYGLQGGARQYVTQIRGDADSVIGLPVGRVREALKEIRN
ncbi:MAG: septum formation protein Maf [Armatimonadetes bacterium]|nr:septum formation protein Maf [Armatimonadota bacterium]MBS1711116.1 septum formation protein Maf [Armatimonadota bacterium]MBX3108789.1 septum formation protein Maf [Fimbriimonadaceae bacterium]